jgi:hypothetical protein
MIGGLDDATNVPASRCFKLNILTMEMNEIPPIQNPRSAFGIVCIFNNIYCIGGSAGMGLYLH